MTEGRTIRGPENRGTPQRALLLAGSLWEIVRFFLILLLLSLLPWGTKAGTRALPWLVFAASGNLPIAVGAILLALFPGRYAGLIGLLRLGKVISVFAFVLLLLSGAVGPVVDLRVLVVGRVGVSLGPALLAVFALDLLFLAALIWLRGEATVTPPDTGT